MFRFGIIPKHGEEGGVMGRLRRFGCEWCRNRGLAPPQVKISDRREWALEAGGIHPIIARNQLISNSLEHYYETGLFR